MTYNLCEGIIKDNDFGDKESMILKLDVFLLNDRLSKKEYNKLTGDINKKD